MQAIIKPAPAPGGEVRQVPVPEIGVRDVLIRVRAASICGTDLHIYRWDRWAQRRLRALLPMPDQAEPRVQAPLKSGALKLDPLITGRMPLADFDKGIQLLLSGDASKILLYPDGAR